jgi:hypothetical protein
VAADGRRERGRRARSEPHSKKLSLVTPIYLPNKSATCCHVNLPATVIIHVSSHPNQKAWLCDKSWGEALRLEEAYPAVFGGLTDGIWNSQGEYKVRWVQIDAG